MTYQYAVAVDPGKTVGVAGTYHDGTVREGEIAWGQLPYEDFGDYMWTLLQTLEDQHTPTLVICERFVITAGTVRKSSDAHWAMRGWGVCEWMAHRYGREFKLQSISDASGFAPDHLLREHGIYVPGRPHANDAIRHLILALAEKHGILPPWV